MNETTEDLSRVRYGDEPRWVGVEVPDGEWLERCRLVAAHDATRLADAILDGSPADVIEWRKMDYRDARGRLAHAQAVSDRMWRDGGYAFPGWLVRP